MKKTVNALLLVCIIMSATSCTSNYENMETFDNGRCLKWGDITYTYYSVLPDYSLIGKQIGITDGDKDGRIYEVKGYDTSEWLIDYYNTEMPIASLMKADNVTNIPEKFVQQ